MRTIRAAPETYLKFQVIVTVQRLHIASLLPPIVLSQVQQSDIEGLTVWIISHNAFTVGAGRYP